MAKRYFVWKNPACNGEDVEWVELTGKEFFRLVNQRKNKRRRFIVMGNDICPEADMIYIEATEEQYADWRVEMHRHEYLRKFSVGRTPVSFDALLDGEDAHSLYDLVADTNAEFEDDVLWKLCEETLPAALASLTPIRREAFELKYLVYPSKSDAEIAKLLGISRKGFSDRKRLALKDLKKIWNLIRQNQKSVGNDKYEA